MRPLDFLGRIKAKLGIVIVLAVVTAFVVNEVGINSGLSRDIRIAIAVVLALIMVQVLARGMIRPLREMAAAAQTIAKGRYGLRVTATSRDEVGELARAFNAMAADLAEVDRQRRELVANVSHELRTPITGLQAVLENMVDGVTPPDLETLGTALAQTQRLGRLVAQLLDLSRLDSGARLIDPETVDLGSLCRQAASEASLARDDVTVVSQVAPGTALYADPALLAQVLANLLDNAVRHSPSGGTVRVEARPAGPVLEISVTDAGPGIPPGERARVFERFSRLDAGRAADAGGAGLGLAIAKEIVELHGGSIAVADPVVPRGAHRQDTRTGNGAAVGRGCRMVVALPLGGAAPAGEGVDVLVRADERREGMDDQKAGGGRPGERASGSGLSGDAPISDAPIGDAPIGDAPFRGAREGAGREGGPGPAAGTGDRQGLQKPHQGEAETRPHWVTAAPVGEQDIAPGGAADDGSRSDGGENGEHTRRLGPGHVGVDEDGGVREVPARDTGGAGRVVVPYSADAAPAASTSGSMGELDRGAPFHAEPDGTPVHLSAGETVPGAGNRSSTGEPAETAGDRVLAGGLVPSPGADLPDGERVRAEVGSSAREPVSSPENHLPGGEAARAEVGSSAGQPVSPVRAGERTESGGPSGFSERIGSDEPSDVSERAESGASGFADTRLSAPGSDPAEPHSGSAARRLDSPEPGPDSAEGRSGAGAPLAPAGAGPYGQGPASGYSTTARHSARAALGAGIGMFTGFFTGLFVAFFLGLYFDGLLGVVAMLLFTAGGAVAGAAIGSSSAARQAHRPLLQPLHQSAHRPARQPAHQAADPTAASMPVPSAAHAVAVPAHTRRGEEPDGDPHEPGGHRHDAETSPQEDAESVSPRLAAPAAQAPTTGTQTTGTPTAGAPGRHPAVLQGHPQTRPVPQEQPGAYGPGRYPPAPEYVPPPLFPRPDLPDAPRWLLPAAASAGLVAAVALPDAPTGLGLVLTAVATGAAAFPAVLPLRRGRITPWTAAFGLLAYALVSVALFRDADWLVAPVLLAAFGVASLALSGGGRGWLGAIRGGMSVALSVLPMPWFLAEPVRRLMRRRRMLPTLVSAVVTVVLLAVFGLLFSSADAVFSAFVSDLLRTPDWAQGLPLRIFVFCVFAVLAAAAVLVGLRPVAEPAGPDLRMSLGRQVWVIPLLGLDLLFASFVTVQITVLFGGNRRVLSTAGLTYAEYARSGFFELVTVSLFVLGIVAGAVALLRRESRADRWLLAVLLGLLCAFTLVILASALHRLGLYTDAYGLSRLRASVEATIWWLGAVFVLVLAAGAVRLLGGGTFWFFRSLVLLTGVSLLVFAVWDPDARVAETQLKIRGVERLDHGYLSDLGAEAVPVLDQLPEPDRSCVLRDVVAVNALSEPDSWNGWNLARARAREVLARHPVLATADCPGSDRLPGPAD